MSSISFSFRVHQPHQFTKYGANDIDVLHSYEDEIANATAIDVVADNCYLPANKILLSLIQQLEGKFKISFSISGTALELLQRFRPDVVQSFRELVATGCVEILAETYYNSLSWLHSQKEFRRQIEKHSELVKELLGTTPVVFRNTELIYSNDLAKFIANLGFKGIICEGLERILLGRSANEIYAAPGNGDFGLLLRNVELSDDIAFRFGEVNWSQHPLTSEKFAEWIHQHPCASTSNINIFFDYETFGIYKKEGTGIFAFLENLPQSVLANPDYSFSTPSIALTKYYPKDIYDVPQTIAWEDRNGECCVWSENVLQNNTIKKLYSLERLVMNSENECMINIWSKLQSADLFYFMAGHPRCQGDAYHLLNPFATAQEAYQNYSNILTDLEIFLIKTGLEKNRNKFSQTINNVLY